MRKRAVETVGASREASNAEDGPANRGSSADTSAKMGSGAQSPWPFNLEDVTPLEWWRTMPADHLNDAQVLNLRATMKKIFVLKDHQRLSVLEGDAAASVAVAIKAMPIDRITLKIDLTMSALALCALDGSAGAAVMLAHILRHRTPFRQRAFGILAGAQSLPCLDGEIVPLHAAPPFGELERAERSANFSLPVGAGMKVQIFSDLHADVAQPRPITVAPDIDAVVVAGDVCEGAERGFGWLRQFVPMQIPIISVLGNHEFYRRGWGDELAQARAVAPLYGIHLLEDDAVVLGNVRFVGASLWTDYALFGEHNLPRAMLSAANGLNDHKRIKWSKEPWRRFRPQEALLLHKRSRTFVEKALGAPFKGATVVVTHHAPHPGSIHSRFKSDLLTAAYVSDLTALIEMGRPNLWIHGHVHESFDYCVGATRIICNPDGYDGENQRFDPALVVEIVS